jgi:hypothetical protein
MMRAAYIVPNRLPRYAAYIIIRHYSTSNEEAKSSFHSSTPPYTNPPAVGGNLSFEDKWPNMAFHPLKNPRDNKINADPREKVIANFEGLRIMIGKKTKKDSKRRKTPTPANAAKYTYCDVPGTLHGSIRK